eukprot:g24874.t1
MRVTPELLANLKARLQRLPNGNLRAKATRHAAILMPLCEHAGVASLLFTKRAQKLNSHKGEVSFPGGMHDELDQDSVATALRETHEEIGLAPQSVEILGKLTDAPSKTGVSVRPVVGWVGAVDLARLEKLRNVEEVESVFAVSLEALLDPAHREMDDLGFRGRIPRFTCGPFPIWGLTGYLTAQLLEQLKHC